MFKLSRKFQKFWYDQINEIGPIFAPILDNFESMTHVYTSFALNKGSSLYHEAIWAARPRIDFFY